MVENTDRATYGVSIIIPCYNDGRYLMEAVSSVYAQDTKLPFEIIVIDDGSSDEITIEALSEAQNLFPDIQVVRNEHMGVSAARNTGLSLAEYDYIFPLDVDNKLSTDPKLISNGRSYMDQAIAFLENDPDTLMVRCNGGVFGAMDGTLSTDYTTAKSLLLRCSLETHAMYRKKEAIACGGYSETIPNMEDWDFSIAMHNHRLKENRPINIKTVTDPVFMYRRRGDGTNRSASIPLTRIESLACMIKRSPEIYNKYYPDISAAEIIKKLRNDAIIQGLRHKFKLAINPMKWPYVAQKIVERLGKRLDISFNKVAPNQPPINASKRKEPVNLATPFLNMRKGGRQPFHG